MPKIRAATVGEHRALAWAALPEAFDELLDEKSYEAITLGKVAKRAGMARNTLYNYVDDKSGILRAAAERSGELVVAAIREVAHDEGARSNSDRLGALIRLLAVSFAHGMRSILLFQTHLNETGARSSAAEFSPAREVRTSIEFVLKKGIKAGEFAPVDNVSLTVDFVSGALQPAVRRILADPSHTQDVAAAAFILRAVERTPKT